MKKLKKNSPPSSVYEILSKKRDGKSLSQSEISSFIKGILDKSIADYQTSALLTSIFINGLSDKELEYLTDAMLYSGAVLNFNDKTVVDKHSTGGVGDKTSFILAPIAAACGVKVPMMAGRGLGHTGGTVDKIEAISGFRTNLSLQEFECHVREYAIALIGQTDNIAPADKKLYALRDVTATVESIPLIAASIMSKKLAEGANAIVMDVKYGDGAFLQKLDDAKKLATTIRKIAKRFKKGIITFITDMNEPLGNAIGNSLEIIESIDTLKNKGPKDLTELSLTLAGGMIFLSGKAQTLKQGIDLAKEVLENGKALEKFKTLIKVQGGNPNIVNDYSLLPLAQCKTEVYSNKSGYLKKIDTKKLGLINLELGGGRKVLTDSIDFGVGLIMHKKISDYIQKGESFLTLYHNKEQKDLVTKLITKIQEEVFILSKVKTKRGKLIVQTKIQK